MAAKLRSSQRRSARFNSGFAYGQRGFSMVQLIFVVAIVLVMSAIALPNFLNSSRPFRMRNDANAIADLVTMARMRAATQFAQVQLMCDLTSSPGTCRLRSLQYPPSSNTWVDEPQKIYLSQGVRFGIPSTITTYLPNQTTAAYQGDSAQYTPLNVTDTTTPVIIFNSRGLPIDINGKLNPDYALYLVDQTGHYLAVSVNLTGRPAIYQFSNGVFSVLPE